MPETLRVMYLLAPTTPDGATVSCDRVDDADDGNRVDGRSIGSEYCDFDGCLYIVTSGPDSSIKCAYFCGGRISLNAARFIVDPSGSIRWPRRTCYWLLAPPLPIGMSCLLQM